MKKSIVLLLIIVSALSIPSYALTPTQKQALVETSNWILKQAFSAQKSGLQLQGQGVVTALLSDDLTGARHQRFILRLKSGQTLLIAHNVDIAPRLIGLAVSDSVAFYGEYEWNDQGGLIHWTHHDPDNIHLNGWLKYKNKIYQ